MKPVVRQSVKLLTVGVIISFDQALITWPVHIEVAIHGADLILLCVALRLALFVKSQS